jgi:protein-S-isoprenylcysteine O-methyltransferase Ste14
MNIKVVLIVSFSFLYGFFEIFMSMRQRNQRSVIKTGDKLSIWILVISISVGYWLSFIIGATKTGRIYHWNTFFLIGAILVAIGLVIRISALLTLKQQFTYVVTKIENHELIEKGLYNRIRHPGYLGQMVIFLGISTSISNWLSIVFMIVPVLIGYMYRITVEEKFMIKQMGQKYIDYRKRTKRLIPLIY